MALASLSVWLSGLSHSRLDIMLNRLWSLLKNLRH